jgi:acetyltransferase-like isoleucine patch superfamily enzyme
MQQPDSQHAPQANQFAHRAGYRWARLLPQPFKERILKIYWPLKSWLEDWQDFSAESIGRVPSHALRLWWLRSICGMRIGSRSSVHRCCRFYRPGLIRIGDHSVINYGVLLDGRRGIEIGNNVSISEGSVILTLGHDIDDPAFGLQGGKVTVEDYVFIGSFARVLPNVRIMEGGVVAAGSVVTHDVEPYTVVGGAPARYIRPRERNLTYQLDFRKRFG